MSRTRRLFRPVALHGGLLAGALVGAYLSWTAEPEDASQDPVVVLAVERADVERITYVSEGLSVTIHPRKDDAGEYLWVETDREVAPPKEAEPPDPEASPEAAPEPAPTPEPQPAPTRENKAFKGGVSADKLVEALTPLRAKRALEGVAADGLADLGLETPTGTLAITHRGSERVFDLGDTVFGGDSRYARDRESGRVYLLDARVLSPLASAHHSMVDRELFRIDLAELERVTVESGGRSVTLEHRNRADRDAAYWGAAGEEGEHATADAWLKKVLRMRARDFLGEGESPAAAEPVFSYRVEGADAGSVLVEVHRGTDEAGEQAWFGKSSHSRGWVRIHTSQASDAAADVGTLFGDAPPAGPGEADTDAAP